MDGYAVRAADVATVPARLCVVGAAPAGSAYAGTVGAGEAVRIFTGAPVPVGADCIVIQEDTSRDGDWVTVSEGAPPGRYVRPEGLDFRAGAHGISAGKVLTARDIGLVAAMNRPWLLVHRRPRVAVLTTGGASVGEHDLVQSALADQGLELDFWKIAMRPGKPLMVGRLKGTPMLGLPGNPVSSLVCGLLFLKPALETMLGMARNSEAPQTARLAVALGANDRRQDYLRAKTRRGA